MALRGGIQERGDDFENDFSDSPVLWLLFFVCFLLILIYSFGCAAQLAGS